MIRLEITSNEALPVEFPHGPQDCVGLFPRGVDKLVSNRGECHAGFFDGNLVSDWLPAEVALDGFQNVCPIATCREIALGIPINDLEAGGVVVQRDAHGVEHNRVHAAAREIIPKRLEHQI